ncbi:uncharacterized protein HGUI_02276 [Hanseniaspora guilliermondii]|uniref:Uncharacterized protein n=1 Tax=Hanseniaspora guilliermondii TaxID=56406 RepID=A0A1L0B2N1_9ASCO|nr:uncharacterized protein HGUI_02276 [Hanseniaspora guilliermondii]
MGYLDTLKKLNKPSQKKIVSAKPSSTIDEEDDRIRLLKIAKRQIDPLDIKTDLLPEDYKPVIPRHIIERNLEKKTKELKKMNSKFKNSGNSSMHQDESNIIKQRLINKYKSKNPKNPKPVVETKEHTPEKKMSFKEMMKLAEGNKKHEIKPVEKKVIKESENKINKKSRFLNREKINEQKRLEAFKNQEKLLSKAKPHEIKKDDKSNESEEKENEFEYTPTGFDLLMEEELEAEEIARREDVKEAKLLKKRALEKQKLKNRH